MSSFLSKLGSEMDWLQMLRNTSVLVGTGTESVSDHRGALWSLHWLWGQGDRERGRTGGGPSSVPYSYQVSHLFVGLTLPLSLSLLFLLGIFNILILCNLRSSRAGLRPPGGRVSGPTARALVSMGVADTALCMTAAPTVLLSDLGVPFPFYPCLLLSCTVLGWAMVSSFHHVLMAYYRWKLITQPHSSRGRQAWSSSLFPLSLCWVAGVAISCLPYLGYNNYPNLQAASYSAAANHSPGVNLSSLTHPANHSPAPSHISATTANHSPGVNLSSLTHPANHSPTLSYVPATTANHSPGLTYTTTSAANQNPAGRQIPFSATPYVSEDALKEYAFQSVPARTYSASPNNPRVPFMKDLLAFTVPSLTTPISPSVHRWPNSAVNSSKRASPGHTPGAPQQPPASSHSDRVCCPRPVNIHPQTKPFVSTWSAPVTDHSSRGVYRKPALPHQHSPQPVSDRDVEAFSLLTDTPSARYSSLSGHRVTSRQVQNPGPVNGAKTPQSAAAIGPGSSQGGIKPAGLGVLPPEYQPMASDLRQESHMIPQGNRDGLAFTTETPASDSTPTTPGESLSSLQQMEKDPGRPLTSPHHLKPYFPLPRALKTPTLECAGSPSSCRVPCIYQNVLSLTYLTYVVFLCGVTLPLGVTCLLYCLAFRAIRAHCRGRALLSPPASSAPRAPSHNSLFYLRQRRVARLTALLFGLYVLSRLPFNLLNAVMLLCPSCPVPYWAPPLAILCAVFSAASNPLIYLVRGEGKLAKVLRQALSPNQH
nr:PREDICTED: uncharacterized protein LOC107076026 [Lepisosteus oculatus]